MTLLIEPEPEVEAAGEDSRAARLRRRLGAVPRLPLRRIVIAVLAAALALVVIWLVCADPVAHIWYKTRQRSLTGEVISAGTTLGSQALRAGDQVGVLQDPGIGLNVVIAQGDSPSTLRGGPGHRPGTPLPGARGNSVVVGHDKDWGQPFSGLSKLTTGGQLYLQARSGVFKLPETGYFVYTVVSVEEVPITDTKLIAPSNDYRLTLITDAGGRLGGESVLVVTAVSGKQGRIVGRAPAGSLSPPRGSLFSSTLLRFLVVGAVAVLLVYFLRRRHRLVMAIVVALPVMLLATWTLFLEFDMVAFRPLA